MANSVTEYDLALGFNVIVGDVSVVVNPLLTVHINEVAFAVKFIKRTPEVSQFFTLLAMKFAVGFCDTTTA
jgi:hypothetical protein